MAVGEMKGLMLHLSPFAILSLALVGCWLCGCVHSAPAPTPSSESKSSLYQQTFSLGQPSSEYPQSVEFRVVP